MVIGIENTIGLVWLFNILLKYFYLFVIVLLIYFGVAKNINIISQQVKK
jgi:hypothetical protein